MHGDGPFIVALAALLLVGFPSAIFRGIRALREQKLQARLPEGAGGRVTLTYGPNSWYQLALALGGLLALLLLAGAIVATRRERTRVVAWPDPARVVPRWRARWTAVAAVVALVVGGPALAVGFVAGVLATRRLVDPPAVGAALIAAAGVVAGLVAFGTDGLPPVACDALAGVGMGLVATALTLGGASRAAVAEQETIDA